jgi:hypothetical protein
MRMRIQIPGAEKQKGRSRENGCALLSRFLGEEDGRT